MTYKTATHGTPGTRYHIADMIPGLGRKPTRKPDTLCDCDHLLNRSHRFLQVEDGDRNYEIIFCRECGCQWKTV